MTGYRKELKYIVSDAVLADVRGRICPLMRRDEHQKGDHYRIRSIYFDSPTFTCYRENQAGVSPREKYRIRTYDCSEDTIKAEIKIRYRDTISKMSTRISRDLFDRLVLKERSEAVSALLELSDNMPAGPGEDADTAFDRVLEKYLVRIMNDMYAPSCIVDYERSAYVYDIGNVRVTFDRNITVSHEYGRMFDEKCSGKAVLSDNMHILEIKYDEFLPDEIKMILAGVGLERISCSKYALCCDPLSV